MEIRTDTSRSWHPSTRPPKNGSGPRLRRAMNAGSGRVAQTKTDTGESGLTAVGLDHEHPFEFTDIPGNYTTARSPRDCGFCITATTHPVSDRITSISETQHKTIEMQCLESVSPSSDKPTAKEVIHSLATTSTSPRVTTIDC